MKIILRDDVDNVGRAGEVVTVKDGYARNYLIPRKLAITASPGNLRAIDQVKLQKDQRDKKRLREGDRIKVALEKVSVTAEVQVGEEDKVFGSVTSAHIAELLKDKGFTIDKRDIVLDEPLKALGVYTVDIKIDRDIVAKVKVWVVKKAD